MEKARASTQNKGGVQSQKCIQDVCEEAQVLNEINEVLQDQKLYYWLCVLPEQTMSLRKPGKVFRPSPVWRSLKALSKHTIAAFFFFVLLVYEKAWLYFNAVIVLKNTEGSQVLLPWSSPVVFVSVAAWPRAVVLGPSPTQCPPGCHCVRAALVLREGARMDLGMHSKKAAGAELEQESLVYFHCSFTGIVYMSWRSGLCTLAIAWGGWKDF